MLREVTIDDIDYTINESRLTFVDCWASWCEPCKALTPTLVELDEKYRDNSEVSFILIDVQKFPEYSAKHDIFGLPCILVFFDGEPAEFDDPSGRLKKKTDRLIGKRPAEHFEAVIEQVLSP
ncbi:MAG: thioredoxin family protein [Candidatus Thorarchaeota archaeon]